MIELSLILQFGTDFLKVDDAEGDNDRLCQSETILKKSRL